MKKVLIWGAGSLGTSHFLIDFLSSKYEIIGYCDSNKKEGYKVSDKYDVYSIDEIIDSRIYDKLDSIIIAVRDDNVCEEIKNTIKEKLSSYKNFEIEKYRDIFENNVQDYILKSRESLVNDYYGEEFIEKFNNWIESIMTEVRFWVSVVARGNAAPHESYIKRLKNDYFTSDLNCNTGYIEQYLSKLNCPRVLDIGCGLAPRFGNTLSNGNKIELIEIDPLAHFYNRINELFANCEYKKIKFGLFEYISHFVEEADNDAIIINNALDHCIDPYRSIVECLSILKEGGILHLNHNRNEGLNGMYEGLHQWNLDSNEKGDFIIWNYNIAVNITERIKDIADVVIVENDEGYEGELCVEIIKKHNFDKKEFVDVSCEGKNIIYILDKVMNMFADPQYNYEFNALLN